MVKVANLNLAETFYLKLVPWFSPGEEIMVAFILLVEGPGLAELHIRFVEEGPAVRAYAGLLLPIHRQHSGQQQ